MPSSNKTTARYKTITTVKKEDDVWPVLITSVGSGNGTSHTTEQFSFSINKPPLNGNTAKSVAIHNPL